MSSLLANGIATLAARLAGPAFSMAIVVGIARVCGPGVLGSYAFLLALLAVFQTAAGGGLMSLLTREMAAHPGRTVEHLRSGRTLAALTGAVAAVGYVVAAGVLGGERDLPAAVVLALTLVPSAWGAVHEAYFMATRTHHRLAAIAAAENALKLGLALLAFRFGGGLMLLCTGFALARVLAFATGAWMASRAGARGSWIGGPAAELKELATGLAPFTLIQVSAMAYLRLDVLLVQAMLGADQTGIYSAAATFFTAALILPDSAMAAVYPRLAARHREPDDGYAATVRVTVRIVSAAMVPVSIAVICISDDLLRIVYGGRYAAAAPVLRLLAAALPLVAANAAMGNALLAGRLQRAMLGVTFGAMVFHAGFTLLLLPRLGLVSGAVSVLVSSVLIGVAMAWTFHRAVSRLAATPRALAAVALVGAPVVLTLLAPPGWRYPAGFAGLFVLVVAAPSVLLPGSGLERWSPRMLRRGPA